MIQAVTDAVSKIDATITTIQASITTFKSNAMPPADVATLVAKLTDQATQLDAINISLTT